MKLNLEAVKGIWKRRLFYATYLGGHPKLKGGIGMDFGAEVRNEHLHLIVGVMKDIYSHVDQVGIAIVGRDEVDESMYEVAAEARNLEVRYRALEKRGGEKDYVLYLGGERIDDIYEAVMDERKRLQQKRGNTAEERKDL